MVLTFIVFSIMGYLRLTEINSGRVNARYFKTYEGTHDLPRKMVQASRNFSNLLEVPTLFYVICLFALFTNNVDQLMLTLAWFYVGFRIIHSIIHITVNKILLRMTSYAISWLILLIMAVRLGIALA